MRGGRAVRQCRAGPTFTSDARLAFVFVTVTIGRAYELKLIQCVVGACVCCMDNERHGSGVPERGARLPARRRRPARQDLHARAAPVPQAARSQAFYF